MPDIEKGQPQPNIIEQGIPHERLVQTFRSLIKEQQDVHASLRAFGEMTNEPEVLPPERAVRGVLDWYAGTGNKELSEHISLSECKSCVEGGIFSLVSPVQ